MSDLERRLQHWLEIDVPDVFARFMPLARGGGIARGEGDTRFLYVPGARKDRVLLVAHADTVWDAKPGYPAPVKYSEGAFCAQSPELGIGADDRAGIAALWELRNLGHSLLLTSGEEKGCIATHWIVDHNPDVLAELNRHQFMVEFDRRNPSEYKCYEVGTNEFRAYVEAQTGFTEPDRLRGSDVKYLATQICGVNLSVGYYDEHTPAERLVFSDWERCLHIAHKWLAQQNLPKFLRV